MAFSGSLGVDRAEDSDPWYQVSPYLSVRPLVSHALRGQASVAQHLEAGEQPARGRYSARRAWLAADRPHSGQR